MKSIRILCLSLLAGSFSTAHAASLAVLMPLKQPPQPGNGDALFVAFMGAVILLGAWLGRCHGSSREE